MSIGYHHQKYRTVVYIGTKNSSCYIIILKFVQVCFYTTIGCMFLFCNHLHIPGWLQWETNVFIIQFIEISMPLLSISVYSC